MKKFTTEKQTSRYTPYAVLAAIGMKLKALKVFAIIFQTVNIAQKTVKHKPVEKLMDAFIAILAGAKGLVEINTRLKSDRALQMAFGRTTCAEQSVVQETLNACNAENVSQLQEAVDIIYRKHSYGYKHNYKESKQLLDIDMTGVPCGAKSTFATKGYFAHQRNRRGRQLGRVIATSYQEIVVDRLFDGKTQLNTALQPLVIAAEKTLELTEEKRKNTILRIDAGGGSLDDVNWMLERGYQVHCKDYSGERAQKLAQSVSEWIDDPKVIGRQIGRVTIAASQYVREVERIAVRCLKNNGQWAIGVLISTLSAKDVIILTNQPIDRVNSPKAVLLANVYFYDLRAGSIEIEIKEDKQGLGITKRNKKRFDAQQMLMLLGSLAHNVIVWARGWLSPSISKLAGFGMLRMVRDIFHLSGFIIFDKMGNILHIVLNELAPLASALVNSLRSLFSSEHIAINLGET